MTPQMTDGFKTYLKYYNKRPMWVPFAELAKHERKPFADAERPGLAGFFGRLNLWLQCGRPSWEKTREDISELLSRLEAADDKIGSSQDNAEYEAWLASKNEPAKPEPPCTSDECYAECERPECDRAKRCVGQGEAQQTDSCPPRTSAGIGVGGLSLPSAEPTLPEVPYDSVTADQTNNLKRGVLLFDEPEAPILKCETGFMLAYVNTADASGGSGMKAESGCVTSGTTAASGGAAGNAPSREDVPDNLKVRATAVIYNAMVGGMYQGPITVALQMADDIVKALVAEGFLRPGVGMVDQEVLAKRLRGFRVQDYQNEKESVAITNYDANCLAAFIASSGSLKAVPTREEFWDIVTNTIEARASYYVDHAGDGRIHLENGAEVADAILNLINGAAEERG